MVTLSSCLIWQIISFILPPNEYGCVYAWTKLGSGPENDLQKMPILAKKYLFRWIDKCYAAKPETIDALKDNIREAIGEI